MKDQDDRLPRPGSYTAGAAGTDEPDDELEDQPGWAPDDAPDEDTPLSRHLARSVDELETSVRTANCLDDAKIRLVGELVRRTEEDLLRIDNFSTKCLQEIKALLSEMGLQLGMRFQGWKPPED